MTKEQIKKMIATLYDLLSDQYDVDIKIKEG